MTHATVAVLSGWLFCGAPGEPPSCCTGGERPEGEPCGTDATTCDMLIDAGDGGVFCGNAWAEAGLRDVDFYRLDTVAGAGSVEVSLQSPAPCVVLIVSGISSCTPVAVAEGSSAGCGTAEVCLEGVPTADNAVFVATARFEGVPCPGADYRLTITYGPADACIPLPCSSPEAGSCCQANGSPSCGDPRCCFQVCAADPFCCEIEWDRICADAALDLCAICACPADVTGDGAVGVADLVAVILAWGPCTCVEDVDGDGEVGVPDLVAVVTGWGPC